MPDDMARLIVALEARTRSFEKALEKANKTANRQSRAIEQRFTKTNRVVTAQFTKLGATAAAALAPAALVAATQGVADSIAKMVGEAEQAGIAFEAFQELEYAAGQSKVSVDALTDGIKEMQLRADEFIVTGKGPAAEAFARLGLSAADLAKGLEEPDKLFEQIIGRLGELDKAAQIRVADEVFGGQGGEQFVKFLDQGVDGIARARKEARELGLVLSDEIGDKAVEIDRRFDLLSKRVGVTLKEGIILAADALAVFIDKFREIEDRGKSSLDEGLKSLGMERLEIETKILELQERQRNLSGALAEAEARQLDGTITQLEARLAAIAAEEKRILGVLETKRPTTASTVSGQLSFTPLPPPGSTKTTESANPFQREVESIKEQTAALVAETAALQSLNPLVNDYGYAVEKAKAEHELLTAAQEAGVAITPEVQAQISALAEGYAQAAVGAAQLAEEQQELQAAFGEFKSLASDVLKGFVSDIRSGVDASEALVNALGKIQDKLLDMALDAAINALFNNLAGAIGGGLGGSSGGSILDVIGYAKGGIHANGRSRKLMRTFSRGGISNEAAIFGEAGPEAAVPLPDGRTIPVTLKMPKVAASSRRSESAVMIELSPDLEARILQEAQDQSVQIVGRAAPSIAAAGAGKAAKDFASGGYDKSMAVRFGTKPSVMRRG